MMIDNAGSAPLDIAVERIGATTVLSVRGELDLLTAPHLSESIDAAVAEAMPSALIIDLTAVPFLASVAMAVLVEAHRRIETASRFAVVAEGPTTSRPLMLMGLHETFALYADLDAALAAFSS